MMNIFSLIKARISIVQVVNDYTTLKRAGAYWKGTCPFHHERTASFTVTPHMLFDGKDNAIFKGGVEAMLALKDYFCLEQVMGKKVFFFCP